MARRPEPPPCEPAPKHHLELDPLARLADLVVKRLQPQLTSISSNLRKIIAMSESLNTAEATLAADSVALKASVDKAVGRLTDLAKQLADALAAAANAGATPDQLAALTKLHEDLTADAAELDSAAAPAA